MSKRTTLNDIARAVGVTSSTVQRALNGMAGVSEEKRQEIKKTAEAMGYRGNVMAKMLHKQSMTIAVALPEPTYYSKRLWSGVEQALSENTGFEILCHRYTYPRSLSGLTAVLEEVWDKHGKNLDGVLTMGEPDQQARSSYSRWSEHRVPVFFVGTEGNPADRLCCCRGISEMAGRIAADLLLLTTQPGSPTKILLTGDFSISDQYADMQGFERVLMQDGAVCELIKLSGRIQDEQMKKMLCDRLLNDKGISAIFSTSARNTVTMCDAVLNAGLDGQVKLIGSDLFPQSRELLMQGRLHAVIDKRPGRQAYLATQALINFVLWNTSPESDILCSPVIATRSNVSYTEAL